MNKFKLLIVCVFFSFVSACASQIEALVEKQMLRYQAPLPETVKLQSGDRVGVLVFLKDSPVHFNMHVSGLVASQENLTTDWNVKQALQNKVVFSLKSLGADVIVLDSSKFDEEKVSGMIFPKDGVHLIKKPKQIAKFKEGYQLKALVVISQLHLPSSYYHVTSHDSAWVRDYGIFTLRPKKYQKVKLVSNFGIDVYHLDPILSAGTAKNPMPEVYTEIKNTTDITSQITIQDVKNINNQELNFIKEKMMRHVDLVSSDWVDKLNRTFQ